MRFLLIEHVHATLVPLAVERKQKTATLHATGSVTGVGTKGMHAADVQVWLRGMLRTVSMVQVLGFVLESTSCVLSLCSAEREEAPRTT